MPTLQLVWLGGLASVLGVYGLGFWGLGIRVQGFGFTLRIILLPASKPSSP